MLKIMIAMMGLLLNCATVQAQTKLTNVFITWYGFNDNSCEVESQHDCNNIAFPKSDGYPTKHNSAYEGKGTYTDPITFATAKKEIKPGTMLYVPFLRKYFIMEDSCAECIRDWNKKRWHVDLWMGPSAHQNATTLDACENKLTQGNGPTKGKGTIIINPQKDLPVDTAPIYQADGQCTTHIYPN